ncbi:MAG: site-specific integrase [Desulfobacteraceae bacterium]
MPRYKGVRQLHSGSWQIDYRVNGERIREVVEVDSAKDAARERAARIEAGQTDPHLLVQVRGKGATFGDLAERYRNHYEENPRLRGYASYIKYKRWLIPKFVEYFGKNTELGNIKYIKLEEYRNHLLNTPYKNGKRTRERTEATVNRAMSCLSHMFTKAKQWDMIKIHPFRDQKLLTKESPKPTRYLSSDEVDSLLEELTHLPWLYRLVKFAIATGQRQGDYLELKWSQVKQDYIEFLPSKTKGKVEMPLNKVTRQILAEIKKEQGLLAQGDNLVFARDGKPITAKIIGKPLDAAIKRAGMVPGRLNYPGEGVGFQTFRHTFGYWLAEKGRTVKEVLELLGHKKIETTMRYMHVSPQYKKRAVMVIDEIFGQRLVNDQEMGKGQAS